MAKRKSLYTEIIDHLYNQKEDIKTNGHYAPGSFPNSRSAITYFINNTIGYIKSIKGLREQEVEDRNRKLKNKSKKK